MTTAEPQPDTCGACIAFLREGTDAAGQTGRCRLRPELGVVPQALPHCPKYVERGTGKTYKPRRAVHGRARGYYDDTEVVIEGSKLPTGLADSSTRRTPRAPRTARRSRSTPRVYEPRPYGKTIDLGGDDMDTEALRALLHDILLDEGLLGDEPMGDRWEGGTVILKPGDPSHQSKEIPIDSLFHKVVMVRDRLRVLEQKINGHSKLSDKDKVDLQQYITRCYGSLTTFNVLFRDKHAHFVGSRST